MTAALTSTNQRESYLKLILFFLSLAAIILYAAPNTLDRLSQSFLNRTFSRTLITFATARGLNAVISMAQGTEFSIQPLGVGVTITPGEVLDPVNDIIEQLANLLLISVISLGTQQILLQILTSAIVSALILMICAMWVACKLSGHPSLIKVRPIIYRLFYIALLLRLGIPLLSLSSELVHQYFLSDKYEKASAEFSGATAQLEQTTKVDPTTSAPPTSMLEKLGNAVNSAASPLETIQNKMEQYKAIATNMVQYIIDLAVVFSFETILLPIFIIWLLRMFLIRILKQI